MTARPGLCPSDDDLAAYGLGKAGGPAADTVADHLETCPDCRRRVAGLSADDFLGRLRDAARSASDSTAEPDHSLDGPSHVVRGGGPTAADLPPELTASGQYADVRVLGAGGMGVVYLARNVLLDRDEVLKMVGPRLLAKPGAADRFLREIRAAAKLQHQNVVAAYTAQRLGDTLVFAMEYVPGDDLAKVVRDRGPLPAHLACGYAYHAALGLQHAHDRGTVHRDIKPSNLILTRAGGKPAVKVLDFGLAKATSEKGGDAGLTADGQMMGTPDFMAPEQARDAARADIRADVYALGCTLYFLLTGRPPFPGGSLYEVLRAHQETPPPPLEAARPEVPAELARAVARMMAKDPAGRYQTPGEVAKVLVGYVKPGAGPAVVDAKLVSPPPTATAPPSPPPPPGWRPPTVFRGETVPRHTGHVNPEDFVPPDRPRPKANRKPVRKRPAWLIPAAVAGAVLLALAAAGAGGLFKAKTPNGTIVIENVPADAAVEVNGEVVTVSRNGDTLTVAALKDGPYRLKVRSGDRVLKLDRAEVEVGGAPVRVSVLPPEAAPPPGPKPPADDPLTAGSVWAGTREYTSGAPAPAKVPYELHIDKRDGARFAGRAVEGKDRRELTVEGETSGGKVTWREKSADVPDATTAATGTLAGAWLDVEFWGDRAGRWTATGKVTLARRAAAAPPGRADRRGRVSGNGTWRRDGDELVLVTDRRGSLQFGDPRWADYTFTAEVRTDDGVGPVFAEVRCGPGRGHFGFGHWFFTARTEVYQDGHPAEVGPDPPRFRVEPGRWYRVAVAARGNDYQCDLAPTGGGKGPAPVRVTRTDARNPAGRVGLAAGGQGKVVTYRFRNLTVTAPDGAVLWEGLPDLPDGPKAGAPAAAAPVVFSDVLGATPEELRKWAAALPAGHRPVWLSARGGTDAARFDAVAVPDPDAPPWQLLVRETEDEVRADLERMHAAGYSPEFIAPAPAADAYLWAKGGEPNHWHGGADYVAEKLGVARAARAWPLSLTAARKVDGVGRKFTFEYRHRWMGAPDFEWDQDLGPDDLGRKVEEARHRGWRPRLVSAHTGRPDPRYAAVFAENVPAVDWDFSPGLTEAAYRAAAADRRAAGFVPQCLTSAAVGGEVRYAVVWVADPFQHVTKGALVPAAEARRQAAACNRYHAADGAVFRNEGGELVIEGGPDWKGWFYFGDPDWTDYDFSARVKFPGRVDGASLFVRVHHEYDGRRRPDGLPSTERVMALFPFAFADNSVIAVEGWRDWSWFIGPDTDPDLPRDERPGLLKADTWHAAAVKVRGDTVETYLDGKLVHRAKPPMPPRGGVGLRAVEEGPVRFKDLKVTAPDGKVLWEGMPELPK